MGAVSAGGACGYSRRVLVGYPAELRAGDLVDVSAAAGPCWGTVARVGECGEDPGGGSGCGGCAAVVFFAEEGLACWHVAGEGLYARLLAEASQGDVEAENAARAVAACRPQVAAVFDESWAVPVPAEPGGLPSAAAEVAEPALAREVVARWAERVAVADGALPGSYLHSYSRRGLADSWVVELDPVRQTVDDVLARTARLCGALGRPAAAVAVDRHPSGNPAQAVLLVSDPAASPIQQGVLHPGPAVVYDAETGWARIGVHPDGEPAEWRLWEPGWGTPCGFVVGETGSGKSVLLTGLAATAMYTGVFSVWAACPQGGSSFPQLVRHSVWPVATTTEDLWPVLAQLRALETAVNVRSLVNGLREQSLHTPTAEEPAVLWIGDEFHELTREGGQVTKAAVPLLDKISRKGRKAAVGIVGASQYGGLATFGSKDRIRTNMFARNAVALRSSSSSSTLVQGLDVDPKHIPPLPGAGYLKGRRTALFRGYWSRDDYAADLAAAPKTEPDRAVAAAMGADWAGRSELRLRKRVQAAEQLRLLDPAAVERVAAADPALAAALAAAVRAEQAGLRRTTIGLHPTQPARAPATPAPPVAAGSGVGCGGRRGLHVPAEAGQVAEAGPVSRVPLTGQELAAVAVFRRFLARAAEVGPDAALAEYLPALGEAAGAVAGAPGTGGR